MGRMRKLVLVALVLVLLAPVSVRAHDHEPPTVRLSTGDVGQKGAHFASCWWRAIGEPNYYYFICIDSIFAWPRAKQAETGATASVRFNKPAPPEEVVLDRWRRVDPDHGIPRGRARSVPFTLTPVVTDGVTTAWEATFTLPQRAGHMYLSPFAVWPDEEGTEQRQDASWLLHLRLR